MHRRPSRPHRAAVTCARRARRRRTPRRPTATCRRRRRRGAPRHTRRLPRLRPSRPAGRRRRPESAATAADRAPPPPTRTCCTGTPSSAKICERVAQAERHAFEHRARDVAARVTRRKADAAPRESSDRNAACARPSGTAPTARRRHPGGTRPASAVSASIRGVAAARHATDRAASAATAPPPASRPSRASARESRGRTCECGPSDRAPAVSVAANTTPDVPIVTLTAPGRVMPMPTAPAA